MFAKQLGATLNAEESPEIEAKLEYRGYLASSNSAQQADAVGLFLQYHSLLYLFGYVITNSLLCSFLVCCL